MFYIGRYCVFTLWGRKVSSSGVTSGGRGGGAQDPQSACPPPPMNREFLQCLWGSAQLCPPKNLPCHATCHLFSKILLTLLVSSATVTVKVYWMERNRKMIHTNKFHHYHYDATGIGHMFKITHNIQ